MITKTQRSEIRRQARLELARRYFWDYCKLMAPSFYMDSRDYLHQLCDALQSFIDSDERVMIINAPPRHGKSWTATLFCQWLLGRKPALKIMTGSYNEVLSETFSKAVRNAIDTVKVDPNIVTYSDVFPGIKVKRGDGAMNRWALEGQHASYLATSPTGTATGFGADIMIVDDLIKSALEANNELALEKQWDWFTNTMLSRLEEGGKIIIIMTRWHTKDLAGRVENHYTSIGETVRKIVLKAQNNDGTMLCDAILSAESYKIRFLSTSPEIVSANYQQEPIDILGKLYSNLKTYGAKPEFEAVRAYIDTADEGDDYLCCIVYGVYNHEAYIIDVLYTQQPMEHTEPAVAAMLTKHHVGTAVIESNNGGRGFARNVERLLGEKRNYFTVVKWFHQHLNKVARILTNATWIMEHMYFPDDWHKQWPEFYEAMNTYQQSGKNKHDDAEDAITGISERMSKRGADIGAVNLRGSK